MISLVELLQLLKKHKKNLESWADTSFNPTYPVREGDKLVKLATTTNKTARKTAADKEGPLINFKKIPLTDTELDDKIAKLRTGREESKSDATTERSKEYLDLDKRIKIGWGAEGARALKMALYSHVFIEVNQRLTTLIKKVEKMIILQSLQPASNEPSISPDLVKPFENDYNQGCFRDKPLEDLDKALDSIAKENKVKNEEQCLSETEQLVEKLQQYRTTRDADKRNYYNYFAANWGGYSKTEKITVVDRLIEAINGGDRLNNLEIKILKQGNLGKIIKAHEQLLNAVLTPISSSTNQEQEEQRDIRAGRGLV